MRSFIQRHLDPSTRLNEVLFGLIMALGITGAVRLGLEQSTNRELLVAVLGCNVAWGIVDGVMFVLVSLFERGRKARIVNSVRGAATDEAALQHIQKELGDRLESLTTSAEREQVNRWVLDIARRADVQPPRIQRDDILGGVAVGLLIVVATLPVVLPFVFISNTYHAVRFSAIITLVLQFVVGYWWGRVVGANPWPSRACE
ncbi:MAG: hypothetical protein FD138_1104 [Planctomycetota bacterium]|nr:MAG: hypothetical protein FD138_1104 [Planctomycetota bacterium]